MDHFKLGSDIDIYTAQVYSYAWTCLPSSFSNKYSRMKRLKWPSLEYCFVEMSSWAVSATMEPSTILTREYGEQCLEAVVNLRKTWTAIMWVHQV